MTRELHERIIVRTQTTTCCFCEGCNSEIDFLGLDMSADLVHTRTRQILEKIETGELHSLEAADGRLLVCSASLCGLFPV